MDPLKWKQLVCRIDALMSKVEQFNADPELSTSEYEFVKDIWNLINNKPSDEKLENFRLRCVAQLKAKFKNICIDKSNAETVYQKVVRHFNGNLKYTGQAVEYFFYGLWKNLLVATTWED